MYAKILTESINERVDLCLLHRAGKTSHVASVVATSVRKQAKIGGTPTQALILSRFQSQTNVRLSERTTICGESL